MHTHTMVIKKKIDLSALYEVNSTDSWVSCTWGGQSSSMLSPGWLSIFTDKDSKQRFGLGGEERVCGIGHVASGIPLGRVRGDV